MSHFYKQLIFISLGVAILAAGGVLVFGIGDKGAAPVARWKMDEGSGSVVYDSSGNANTGRLVNPDASPATSSMWASSVYGTALQFDGTDDTVNFANDTVMGTGNMTFSFWVKTTYTGYSNQASVFGDYGSDGASYWMFLMTNNSIYFATWDSLGVGANTYKASTDTDGIWHHIVGVRNGNYLQQYRDGVFTTTSIGTVGNVLGGGDKPQLGWVSRTGLNKFNGLIDDVRIYNYARTADQVRNDYNDGKALYVGVKAAASCDVDPASCVNKGLVGYWDMSQMGGQTVADKSGNANTGTLGAATTAGTDDPKWTTGVQPFSGGRPGGGALKFDGVDDYVGVADSAGLRLSNVMTISAWIKPDTVAAGFRAIVNKRYNATNRSNYYFGRTGNKLYFEFTDDGVNWRANTSVTTAISAGVWTYVVVVYDDVANTTTFYQNGIAESLSQTYSMLLPTSGALSIGRNEIATSTENFNGAIDDVRVYNRALSAAEISYQYNQAKPIAQWKFDEGSGNYAYDSSGNANTGSLYLGGSATSSAWVSGAYGGAMSFDGTDDYVSVADNNSLDFNGSGKFSIGLWFKTSTTTQRQFLISKYAGSGTPGYYIDWSGTGASPNNKIRLVVYDNVDVTPLELDAGSVSYINGQWHHLTVVFDGASSANSAIYLDGALNSSGQINQTGDFSNAQPFYIGNYVVSSIPFAGAIDDVRVYNYARTADQVRNDYNDGKALYVGTRAADCDVSPADCVNKGLVGYWDMSAMGGQTVADKSGNANTGTLGAATTPGTDDPKWAQGIQPFSGGRLGGGALNFDGVDDYVGCGNVSSYNLANTNHSFSAWFKAPSLPTDDYAIILHHFNPTSGYYLSMYTAATGKLQYYEYADGGDAMNIVPTTNYADNRWHFVVAVMDITAKTGYLYVDGAFVLSDTYTGNLADFDGNLRLGGNASISNWYGSLDDVRIYNRALSAAEIRYQYNQAKPIAWWKMDEGADTATTCNATTSSVYDYSGQGNTGTLFNANASPATSSMWSDGKYGCALTFDGTDDYVLASSTVLNITGNLTISAWIKKPLAGGTTARYVVGKDNTTDATSPYYLMTRESGVIALNLGNGTSSQKPNSVLTFPANTWAHIVAVADGSFIRYYINGVADTPVAQTKIPYSLLIPLHIGGTQTYFDGLIDDIRIYNYARTADQIRTDYNASSALHLGN